MVNTSLRKDGVAIYKSIPSDPGTKSTFEAQGWREWSQSSQPMEAKAFDPELLRLQKEQKEREAALKMERLQSRFELVIQHGGKPVLADLEAMSEPEFQAALQELINSAPTPPNVAVTVAENEIVPQQFSEFHQAVEPKKTGRPSKAVANVGAN